MSPRRLTVFRLGAVAIALFPFLLFEFTLYLLDVPTQEAVRDSIDHDPFVDLHQLRPLFEPSPDGSTMQIPQSRMNFFRPASFPIKKSGKRAFVVGGSTVQGQPYATETAFAKFLEIQLDVVDPEASWEVINCGGTSYASFRVAAIVQEVIDYQPDLIILYTGHNEFLEDRTYATHRLLPRWLARTLAPAMRLRSIALVSRWVARPDGNETRLSEQTETEMAMEVDTMLDHRGGLEGYKRDDRWRQGVEQHFAVSIQRMLRMARDAHVPVVLCVPVSDVVNTPPFKIELPADATESERRTMEGYWRCVMDTQVDLPVRIEAAKKLRECDPKHPGAAYFLGRQALDQRQWTEASGLLNAARDNDVCPLRATSTIQSMVRDAAADYQVACFDTEACFRFDQGGNHPDPKWFVDHVHPSLAGHQRIANALLEMLAANQWIGATPSDLTDALAQRGKAIEDHLSGLDETYFQRGKQRLKGLRQWAQGRSWQK